MLQKNCQVCGNPMYSRHYLGTEADGALNVDFCSSCYKGGQFYNRQPGAQMVSAAMPWAIMRGL